LAIVGGLSLVAFSGAPALAIIQVADNVLLSTDSDTDVYGNLSAADPVDGIEGLDLVDGNTYDRNAVNPTTNQVTFEGIENIDGTANINVSIIVGRSSRGQLNIIDSTLRDMDLVIGDQATINGVLQRGKGTVRIEGLRGVFNNNPNILPLLPGGDPDAPMSPSVVPRPTDVGYDLFVGRNGIGELNISLGGTAEVQDAVIVGDNGGGQGTLRIDGNGSYLGSGGFETVSVDPSVINYMIIGRLGSGTMSITNGGQAYNLGPILAGGGDSETFGAVIGAAFAAVESNAPGAAGQGTVNVVGGDGGAAAAQSTWTVGGTLQVGGFHNNRIGVGPNAVEDLDGNEVVYGADVGRGTLHVGSGGLVNIVTPPLDPDAVNVPNRLDLLVGRFGTIDLAGGKIELLGAFDNSDPDNPGQELENGRLINDGIVQGYGSINVLQFRNRVLGRVSVNGGQELLIDTTGIYEESDLPVPGGPEYPLSNYGVIDVLGTETARAEIHFRRTQGSTSPPLAESRPLLNLPVETMPLAPNGRTEGLIHGEYSTMHFDSGLWNRGVLAFTRGDNVVSGDVISFGESAPGAGDRGRVLIGPDTNVAFEDDFFSFGLTQISPGASFQVLKGSSFAVGGVYTMSITATTNGLELTGAIPTIAGDASFSGDLQVSIGGAASNIGPGATLPIFNVGGDITGNFSSVTPSGLPFGSPIDLFTFVFGQQMFLAAFEIPDSAVFGPDLNGDGFVDSLDYAIWKQNFGSMGTPGMVAGDTNNDGKVDAADYTVWRDACCGPFPGAGSGAGIGFGGANVPEPASCMLLASVGLAVFAFGRHRAG
jgi:hypothetical protein